MTTRYFVLDVSDNHTGSPRYYWSGMATYPTIEAAVADKQAVTDRVIAIEEGRARALNPDEERECLRVLNRNKGRII
jgi:hypothetical protein